MTLSARVLLGLGLGIVTGLFFGESTAFLEVPGRAFVILLQMTVLPYVSVALVGGLGRLDVPAARALARSAGGFLLVLWAIALSVVVMFPAAFPGWESATFFSSALVAEPAPFDPVSLYLPANPFAAFANGVVPAVVVFSVALGISLMASQRKEALLASLATLEDALLRIASFVVGLAPYGVFAIAAHAAGTIRADQALALWVYGATFAVCASILAFWVLPVLVTSLTPFTYREFLTSARAALITAFATGSVFVVLPILASRSKELLAARDPDDDGTHTLVDVIVPISFTLASAGKLMSLAFVLFAGWVSGFALSPAQIPGFLASGVFSFFASTMIAIPFMLDLYRVPSDTFQLFIIADNVIGNRFGSMLAAVHILALTLLGACGTAGLVRARGRALARWAGVSVALLALGLGGLRLAFESIDKPYEGYRHFIERDLLLPQAPVSEASEIPRARRGATLERIRRDELLRVGWLPERLPFVFRNDRGALVGMDVEMAHQLARDLGVRLELVQIELADMPQLLRQGHIDMVMSGLLVVPQELEHVAFTDAMLDETLAFVVPDHERDRFRSWQSLRAERGLRLAVLDMKYYADKLREFLPQAELVQIGSIRDFYRGGHEDVDALAAGAETGSAWTLIYPQFSVAVPQPGALKGPVGYAVARGDPNMVEFLNAWLVLKRKDRTLDRLFDYWFQGKRPPEIANPRWSILHDVFGRERAAPEAEGLP